MALVAGGSGLVGRKLLAVLLHSPEYVRVHALSRRPLPLDHPRLANRTPRFDAPFEGQLTGVRCQDAYCCLGTTIRDAGSREAMHAIDFELVMKFARFAASVGAERFAVVSAVGADIDSKNAYLRTKGEMELALETLRFRGLDIMQPSLLLGSRRSLRPLELIAQPVMMLVNPLLLGAASRFRAIDAGVVAAAMYGAARSGRRGVYRHTYDAMRALAQSATSVK
jgi:uncharacterized protein YbjT (DUF2867 family)